MIIKHVQMLFLYKVLVKVKGGVSHYKKYVQSMVSQSQFRSSRVIIKSPLIVLRVRMWRTSDLTTGILSSNKAS